MIWSLIDRKELFLYFILIFITALLHLLLAVLLYLLNALPDNSIAKKQLQVKLRQAGVENSRTSLGDIAQMKKPEKIVKDKTEAKKQLQTSKKTLFRVNFARKIAPITPQKKQVRNQTQPTKKTPVKKSPPPLDLSDLGYKQEQTLPAIEYRQNDIASYVEQQRILETITGQAATVDLSQVSSSVQIEVPHGVPLDQLNTVERKFYSFKNRVFKAYVYSLLNQAYNQQTPSNRFPFTRTSTRLYARVTFDRRGNIQRIQTIETGNNPKLQKVFLDALKDIRAIPNPPKEIINEDNEFIHGFILEIRN